MLEQLSPVATGLGVGLAVASAPGPVQAVLLGETVRGGMARGLRALVGANLTFGSLLVLLALGVSLARPNGAILTGLQVAGGFVLLWLGVDGFRSASSSDTPGTTQGSGGRVPPTIRGAIAVLAFPGTWIFLAAVASPLLASARGPGGTGIALATALALMAGAGIGDALVVLIGTRGVRAAGDTLVPRARRALSLGLVLLGLVFLTSAGLSALEAVT
jgi:threonine/homoserine/homoserine lactone efflux protein